MRTLSEGHHATASPRVVAEATRLGWVEGSPPRVTPLGQRIGDSLREYLYWEERNRHLPRRDDVPELRAETYRGARVLEIGSGFGCNLMRLQEFADEVVGVDIDPIYLALGPVLANLAGVEAPRTLCARAENLPFPDDRFDAVLVIGALQYMEIPVALREIARVLRPGGQGVFVLGHLTGYLHSAFVPNARRSPRAFARETRDLLAMLTYPKLGRRLSKPGSPVYPTRRRATRYFEEAGLRLEALRDLRDETAYIVRR
ncbi:MAG: class I SAM-dependent methyltransferase [Myxococcales bacterium]|nr:class I SAM-dependent methyltransferase [Myxococcales bacterium]